MVLHQELIKQLKKKSQELRFKSYLKETDIDKYLVLGYIISDLGDFKMIEGTREIVIGSYDNIEFPEDSRDIFRGTNFRKIYLKGVDTSKVKTMDDMFYCSKVEYIDMRGLDVGKVESLYGLCSMCLRLEQIDWEGLNFSKVENISFIFSSARRLKIIDLNVFHSGRLENMCGMLQRAVGIEKILLDKVDTSNVIDLSYAFYGCEILKLDISMWNIKSVKYIHKMFEYAKIKDVNIDCFRGCIKDELLDDINKD